MLPWRSADPAFLLANFTLGEVHKDRIHFLRILPGHRGPCAQRVGLMMYGSVGVTDGPCPQSRRMTRR